MSRNSVCLCATSTTPNCWKSTIPSAANSRSDAPAKFSRYSPKPARLSHWRTRPFAEGALPSLRVSTEATGIAPTRTVVGQRERLMTREMRFGGDRRVEACASAIVSESRRCQFPEHTTA